MSKNIEELKKWLEERLRILNEEGLTAKRVELVILPPNFPVDAGYFFEKSDEETAVIGIKEDMLSDEDVAKALLLHEVLHHGEGDGYGHGSHVYKERVERVAEKIALLDGWRVAFLLKVTLALSDADD